MDMMERSYDEIQKVLEEMQKKQQLIFSQAKELNFSRTSIASVLEELCSRIVTIIGCERVSIWLFNKDRTILTAQNSYTQDLHQTIATGILRKEEVPSYFEAVQKGRVVDIFDIENDSATKELFRHPLYRNTKVKSMLDASIILSGGIGGIVCCETIAKREWTRLDKVLVASIADMLSFIFDRLDRIEVEEHVHRLAYSDRLTGLDNENAFEKNVTEQLNGFTNVQKGAFIYIMLDQFTEIQGVLGPEGTDKLLYLTASRLKKMFPSPAIAARLAFDHFVIFTPFTGELAGKRSVMERVASELRQPMYISGQEVYMTFSYGVSVYPDHALNVKNGLQTAYMALQSGRKTSNRKSSGVYNPDMHTYLKETVLSEMNLRKGLDMNEFKLFYQPQVNCRTGEVIGFEALIRWQHPERGLIFPGEFINLAESTGLIMPIGEWVIQEAVQQLKKWAERGMSKMTVSVNLSPRHFLHHNFPFYLDKCIREAGIKPEKLILEITENVALEDQTAVTSRISLLKEMGFSISIDDFGKGYSAFIYLQHFPIQQIKIDRQFISELETDSKSTGIVQTIIHLAELLGLQTIGEGVETKEQWDILKSLGCSELQGYYFSRPVPVQEIDGLFDKYGRAGKLILPSIVDYAHN